MTAAPIASSGTLLAIRASGISLYLPLTGKHIVARTGNRRPDRGDMPSEAVQLAQAQAQIEQVQRRIEEQIDLIERLHADGHDTTVADLLLVTLLDVRLKFTAHLSALEGKP